MNYQRLMYALGPLLAIMSYAGEIGVVVEEVGSPSILEKVGVQSGDVFLSWELLPLPPLHEGAKGVFETVFHWLAFLDEQVPRGAVRLFGVREGIERVVEVPEGDWYGNGAFMQLCGSCRDFEEAEKEFWKFIENH